MTVATEDASQSATTRSRFVVGIDLGTTNSAVGYVDTHAGDGRIHTFAIAQLVAPGQVERCETLPSFHYEPAADELAAGALRLPWSRDEPRYGVGVFAREHGRSVPGRLIESAKSWLCHAGVDRRAALLPWHGAADVEQLSPVEVSARYLRHIREAWDASFPDELLERQDVVLTIPASFEEVARELTLAAARSAGLPRIVLIEEPQAAFYAWVDVHRDNWEEQVAAGQTILICDVGGGTSDFTLLHVRRGEGDKLRFHRVAVGEHLILGGDNLDLALAHHIEHKLAGEGGLEPRQWSVLVPTCRQVKETLLSAGAPDHLTFTLPGTGARLIGGSLQVQVTRDEVTQLLVEGFLPRVAVTDKPARRQSGFQEFGLPYAPDAAITRYLAAFLTAHRDDSDPAATAARPVDVLFNGGFFASPVLRERMLEVLGSWFSRPRKKWSPRVFQNERLDLAVAHGAAYFGMVRRGVGVRISAGLARTYYVGVEAAAGETAALCLIAAGTEPSAEPHAIDREFDVRTSEPVEFPIFVSSTRLTDRPGTLLPIDEEHMTSLPPIRTVLRTRKASERATLKARLSARLSEIGTLEMWCQQVDGSRRWQLQFDVRSAVETQREAHTGAAEQSGIVDQELLDAADEMVQAVFGPTGRDDPAGLVKRLAARLELRREEWPPSLLRSIWASLMDCESGRRRGEQHEARWLNLLGFALRPGFGLAADDWRVEETWRTLRSGLVDRGASCQSEWWILWRRIAGGLNRGRQIELTSPVISVLRREYRATGDDKSGAGSKHAARWGASAEIWRALGAMEFLPPPVRIELGELIVHALAQPRFQPIRNALVWSLGRIGTRVPVNGPLNSVLPPDVVGDWLSRLLRSSEGTDSDAQLAVVQLARRTGDRYRDLPNDLRQQAVDYLERTATSSHFIELVRDGGSLDTDEASRVFGEALPTGLRLA